MEDKWLDPACAATDAEVSDTCEDPSRRRTVKLFACAALAAAAGVRPAWGADEDPPRVGDRLVREGDESKTPLTSADIKFEKKQLIVWPQDAKSSKLRDGSRLNRIVVIKLDPKQMDADTAKAAADGVVAYSAVCVHQNCDVNGWLAKEKEFLCICHFSKYSPLRKGAVTGGPAPRALPIIPLKIEDGKLAIAGDFSAPPGGAPQA